MHLKIGIGDQNRGGSTLHLIHDPEKHACDMRWATTGYWFPLTVDDVNLAHFATSGLKVLRMKYGLTKTAVIRVDEAVKPRLDESWEIPSSSVIVIGDNQLSQVTVNVTTHGPVVQVLSGQAQSISDIRYLCTDFSVYRAYSQWVGQRSREELPPLEMALFDAIAALP